LQIDGSASRRYDYLVQAATLLLRQDLLRADATQCGCDRDGQKIQTFLKHVRTPNSIDGSMCAGEQREIEVR
jgi:hypothetical protein